MITLELCNALNGGFTFLNFNNKLNVDGFKGTTITSRNGAVFYSEKNNTITLNKIECSNLIANN